MRWSSIPLALASLFASFEAAGADSPGQRVTGSFSSASLGMPLVAVVCSTSRQCVAIGTPTYGSSLGPIAVQTADGGANWASTSNLSGIKNLYALTCASARTCVAVGGNPQGNGERGAVLRTLNGGGSWSLAPALPRGVGRLVGISCPTKSFCMAVGVTTAIGGASAVTSNNAGKSWSTVAVPRGEEQLNLVTCTTRRSCIAEGEVDATIGDPSGGSRLSIITTTNGGSTWTQSSIATDTAAPLSIPYFGGLTCASATHCFLVGDATPPDGSPSGVILSSADSGASWTNQAVPPGTTMLNAISCGSATQCAVAGGGIGARGGTSRELLTTSDGGQLWTSRTVPSSAVGLEGVSCPSTTSCTAVGFDLSATDPSAEPAAVVVSSDGGTTWNSVS